MSKIALSPDPNGAGIFTIASPNSGTNRTLTLPDNTGTVVSTASTPTFTGAVTAPAFTPNSSTVPTDGMFLPTTSTVAFATGTTERARIDSSGNFGIGTASPSSFGTLGVVQAGNASAIGLRCTNASYTAEALFLSADRNTTNATFYFVSAYNYGAAAYKLRIADSGTVTNATGTYTTISDIKLKQDIVDAKSQWNDIKSLRIVNYRLKEYVQADPNAKPFIGLIAQEVEKVCPSLIEEQEDAVPNEDGKLVKNGEITKGIKTSILYMKAVKALQEAMERIEALEVEVAALKGSK